MRRLGLRASAKRRTLLERIRKCAHRHAVAHPRAVIATRSDMASTTDGGDALANVPHASAPVDTLDVEAAARIMDESRGNSLRPPKPDPDMGANAAVLERVLD